MSDSPESSVPSPIEPPPHRRLGWLWRRGRLVLLILGGLGVGQWYRARSSATESAALLHGSVGQLGACVVAGRPPDPLNPNAARTLDAMLFRRLALSLETAHPLSDCAELARGVQERVKTHRKNFYHRSPAEVTELADIAGRLASLDLDQSALALSKKPEPGQPESTTQALLRDLGRALTLSCDIAQAEKAYAVGACPVPGAPPGARGAPASAPQVALDVSLGEPVAGFELVQGASIGERGNSTHEPRLLVSALGRRGKARSWIAGLVKTDQGQAAWRTLAVPAPDPTPEAETAATIRRELVASPSGSWLVEASTGASRVIAVDAALTAATQQFPPLEAGTNKQPPPLEAGTNKQPPPLEAGTNKQLPVAAKTSHPAPWLGVTRLPLGPDLVAVPATTAGAAQLSWLTRSGKQIRTATLKGQLVAVLLAPPRLLLADPWTTDPPSETTLSVWTVDPSGVSQGSQLKLSHFAFDAQGRSASCSSQQGGGEDLLLAQGSASNWLLRLAPAAGQPSLLRWPAQAAESLRLGCGSCAPFVIRAVGRQLWLVDLAKQAQQPSDQPAIGSRLETPVLFSARSASSSSAACSAGVRVIAYSAGGAILIQRISKDGKAGAPLEVAGPSDQGQTTTPWLISQGDRLLLFWRRVGGATRPDRLKLEVAETRDAGLTWR